MDIQIREYTKEDTKEAIRIWNHIVEEGNAFPQMDCLTESTGEEFFLGQSYTGIAVDVDSGEIAGLYILHPNHVGRCGHICNASYAVRWDLRGCQIGEKLVRHCMEQGKALGYGILRLTRWSKAMKPPFICTKSWDLPGLASYHGDS